ncbi:hypothetical protein JRO89_XS05G0254100 [Xanthoceras sorbifolium]|uniref:Elongator complex protein 2 n=1 Tax=Xanthoceras sorbifolium TaxID=99658 RepID=A0ABQ8I3V0_9ROSI|nr:hypothetical protein JRO89_XS05G0254100 [Xanthoceras sorbifolium]
MLESTNISSANSLISKLLVSSSLYRCLDKHARWTPSFAVEKRVCRDKREMISVLPPSRKAVVSCRIRWVTEKAHFKADQRTDNYAHSKSTVATIFGINLDTIDEVLQVWLLLIMMTYRPLACLVLLVVSENLLLHCGGASLKKPNILKAVDDEKIKASPCEVKRVQSFLLFYADGFIILDLSIYSRRQLNGVVLGCSYRCHFDIITMLDWITSCCIELGKADSVLLVSSSQDKGIRIWKMALRGSSADTRGIDKKAEISLASYIEGPVLVAGSSSYQISLESLLIGHEDWVYSVEWEPPSATSSDANGYKQPLSILSASMDKTMMIWQPERTTGIWMNVVTVGELSHSALGFYGGHWSPDGSSILAHGYGGSFHLWKNVGVDIDNWQPQKVPSGHFAAVTDIAWARSGDYVLSVSHDQTTRVFAPWQNITSLMGGDSWHEVARPQVHGHDINCVTIIQGKGNHHFVSGADEKVARVFEAPLSFLKTLNHATSQTSDVPEDLQGDIQVLGANMSALGLSQKPIYVNATRETPDRNGNDGLDTLESIPDAVPVVFTEPPIEDQLAWHTLWPESHKLYGHGNELFSLCCDHQGKLVASSCKAQSTAMAEIWLWEVGSWKAVGRLQSHSLTVTQIKFSHDDKLLLSVSRDRQFSIFAIARTGTGEINYKLVVKQEAHKRIIWSCSWNPFGHEFATGSRDKTVKIWAIEKESSVKQILTLPTFSSSVTALSWVGLDRQKNNGVLAVGMESGLIEIWSLSLTRTEDGSSITVPSTAASLVAKLDPFMCHVSAVNRLAWKNNEKTENSQTMQLASCGADNCVRVFEVSV